MSDAFLPGDAADKQDVRHGRVHSVFGQGGGVGGFPVFDQIDAVVDDVDAGRVNVRVGAQDVCPGALRYSDDGVGIEDRGLFHPGAHGVAAAQLLCLPGAQGFQRVGGEDEGHSVKFLGEIAGHRHIPGMSVDDIDSLQRLDLRQVQAKGLESSLELGFGSVGDFGPGFRAADVQVAVVGVLRPPTVDFDLDLPGQFTAQVIDVDTGAAVDLRGKLAGE